MFLLGKELPLEPPQTHFPLDELPGRLVAARCALCGAGGFVIELEPDSKRITRGLVRVERGHICPDCAREASARYARIARRISSPDE